MSEKTFNVKNDGSKFKIKYPIKIGNLFMLSFEEEFANAMSHGICFLLLLFSLPFISVYGYIKGGSIFAIGYSIYIISIMFMFLFSTLYHSMGFDSPQKFILRKLDHSAIFLAIAGSFTPIILIALNNILGYIVLIAQWVLVVIGVIYKSFSKNKNAMASTTIYLIMGWSALILIPDLIKKTSWVFLLLIILGGILYSVGVYFYSKKDKAWYHFIWHCFIILASLSHFIAIIFLLH